MMQPIRGNLAEIAVGLNLARPGPAPTRWERICRAATGQRELRVVSALSAISFIFSIARGWSWEVKLYTLAGTILSGAAITARFFTLKWEVVANFRDDLTGVAKAAIISLNYLNKCHADQISYSSTRRVNQPFVIRKCDEALLIEVYLESIQDPKIKQQIMLVYEVGQKAWQICSTAQRGTEFYIGENKIEFSKSVSGYPNIHGDLMYKLKPHGIRASLPTLLRSVLISAINLPKVQRGNIYTLEGNMKKQVHEFVNANLKEYSGFFNRIFNERAHQVFWGFDKLQMVKPILFQVIDGVLHMTIIFKHTVRNSSDIYTIEFPEIGKPQITSSFDGAKLGGRNLPIEATLEILYRLLNSMSPTFPELSEYHISL